MIKLKMIKLQLQLQKSLWHYFVTVETINNIKTMI